jgi:hypothetical protein
VFKLIDNGHVGFSARSASMNRVAAVYEDTNCSKSRTEADEFILATIKKLTEKKLC